jgi:hypothetical protein
MSIQGFDTPQEAWKQWTSADVKKFKVSMYRLADGKYQGFVPGASVLPPTAVRLKPQPAYPRDKDPRQGTKQALQKLEAKHPRQIEWACYCAVQIAQKNLTVHSRAVREEMERRELIGADTGAEFWLGAAMSKLTKLGILKSTGSKYKYSDSSRGIHEREVTIWALVDGADTSYFDEEPKEKP